MSVRISVGTVVIVMYRMWVKISVPAIAGARLVVSLSGLILSPKYAPLIIAPATTASFIPIALPIPSKATPMVATVDHELPVAILTIAPTTTAVTRKSFGLMMFNP